MLCILGHGPHGQPRCAKEDILCDAPTRLILAQLLGLNSMSGVGVVANKKIKMVVAKQSDAGNFYVKLDHQNSDAQWQQLMSS